MNLSTMTTKGQVTVPVDFRKMLGLSPNDRVIFTKKGKDIVIRKAVDILDLAGSLKPKKNKGVDPVKAREYMETHYKRV